MIHVLCHFFYYVWTSSQRFPAGEIDAARIAAVEFIERYAAKVARKGYYLDILDAELFACRCDVRLSIMLHSKDGLSAGLVSKHLETFLPDDVRIDYGSSDPERKPDDWCLLSCNAVYDPEGVRNHWVPVFYKDSLSDEHWHALTASVQTQQSLEIASLKTRELELIQRIATLGREDEVYNVLFAERLSITDEIVMFLAVFELF